MKENFHDTLKIKMDRFVHLAYTASKEFPKEEVYGLTSQFRRAALSIVLNYIEGYARNRHLVLINFLEISYGSLKECKYLISFSYKEGYLDESIYKELLDLSEEIGAMLWTTLKSLRIKTES